MPKARVSYNVGKLVRGLKGDWKEVGASMRFESITVKATAFILVNTATPSFSLRLPEINRASKQTSKTP